MYMEDEFYILATDSSAEEPKRVLKDGETFAVFDLHGDIQPNGPCQEGLYHEGTRFLSHLLFKLGHTRPFLLNSTVQKDNLVFVANLTNPDIYQAGRIILPRGTLHITRTKMLWQGVCYETLSFGNYGLSSIDVQFSVEYSADFADLFEVRGMTRERRGVLQEATLERSRVRFDYTGLDNVVRRTQIECSPPPDSLSGYGLMFRYRLEPKEEREFHLTYSCQISDAAVVQVDYSRARAAAQTALTEQETPECRISTSNEQFNEWLARSSSDLHMMFTATPFGVYPYAGVPWFSTAFGRDGIITALEYLWINPTIARGVLNFLAALQCRQTDADSMPSRARFCMKRAGVRWRPSEKYRSGSTMGPSMRRRCSSCSPAPILQTAHDLDFIRSIWPSIDLALDWMDRYGDRDDDGFIEYARLSAKGLIQQGWKDSWDSVSHKDGSSRWRAHRSLRSSRLCLCRQARRRGESLWRWVKWRSPKLLLIHAAKLKDQFSRAILVQ